MSEEVLTGRACRAARQLLGISLRDLARESSVHKDTIAKFERGDSKLHNRTRIDLRRALERLGAEFSVCDAAETGLNMIQLDDGWRVCVFRDT